MSLIFTSFLTHNFVGREKELRIHGEEKFANISFQLSKKVFVYFEDRRAQLPQAVDAQTNKTEIEKYL